MSEVIINLPEINLEYNHLEKACYDINDLKEKYFQDVSERFTPDGRMSGWNPLNNWLRIRKNFNSFQMDDLNEVWYKEPWERENCAIIVLEPSRNDSEMLTQKLKKLEQPFNDVFGERVRFKVTNSFHGTYPGRTEIEEVWSEGLIRHPIYKTKKFPRFSKQSLTILCNFTYGLLNAEKFALLVATELQLFSMLLMPKATEKKIYMSDALRLEMLMSQPFE